MPFYDLNSRFHVREVVGRCQDGFAFKLLVQFSVSPAVWRERSGIHEPLCKVSTELKKTCRRLHTLIETYLCCSSFQKL